MLTTCSLSAVTEEESDVRALLRCEKAGAVAWARSSSRGRHCGSILLFLNPFPHWQGMPEPSLTLLPFKELTHQIRYGSLSPFHPFASVKPFISLPLSSTSACLSPFRGWHPHCVPQATMPEVVFISFVWRLSCLFLPFLQLLSPSSPFSVNSQRQMPLPSVPVWWFQTAEIYSHSSGDRMSKIKMLARPCSLRGSRGRSFLASGGFQQSLMFLDLW